MPRHAPLVIDHIAYLNGQKHQLTPDEIDDGEIITFRQLQTHLALPDVSKPDELIVKRFRKPEYFALDRLVKVESRLTHEVETRRGLLRWLPPQPMPFTDITLDFMHEDAMGDATEAQAFTVSDHTGAVYEHFERNNQRRTVAGYLLALEASLAGATDFCDRIAP